MKWFRKQGEAPRLLSLSPLRTPESEQVTNLEILTPPKHVKRRSRLGKLLLFVLVTYTRLYFL
jgi:hypothetical protein